MEKYYYIDLGATPCAKVYEKTEPLQVLPKNWQEISAEQFKEITGTIQQIPNAR